jgi:hypothetical protein
MRINYLLFFILIACFGCNQTNRKVKNVQTFAKVYGYVRWFYPGDESATIDWDKFAVYGVKIVENAKDEEELQQVLLGLFKPIAPSIQIEEERKTGTFNVQAITPKDTTGLKKVAWRHYGVYLGEQSNIYKSTRINRDTITENDRSGRIMHTANIGDFIRKDIGNHLICTMPLALYSDKKHTFPASEANKQIQLTEQLDRITNYSSSTKQLAKKPVNELTPKLFTSSIPQNDRVLNADDYVVRLANVVIAWNVFQHFYPYFDVVHVDWEKELEQALSNVYDGKTEADYFKVLSRMVAKLEDGHGVVYNNNVTRWGFPIMVSLIRREIVVTAVSETGQFKKGDIIISLDGKAAFEELQEQETLISGSPQLRRYRALNVFGSDFVEQSKAVVTILRQGKQMKLEINRQTRCNLFFNSLSDIASPVFRELDDRIYYMNYYNWNTDETLKKLAGAKTIIINQLQDEFLFIPHIIKQPVWSPRWNIPETIYPDRKSVLWDTTSRWQIQPQEPYIKAKLIFLTHSYDISAGETFLGIIDNYKLGKLVGDTTAGTNGNANFIPLMGDYSIMWTGMKVLKHDSSQHHGIGILPNVYVTKTIKGIQEGHDEFLDKAIEIAKQK